MVDDILYYFLYGIHTFIFKGKKNGTIQIGIKNNGKSKKIIYHTNNFIFTSNFMDVFQF